MIQNLENRKVFCVSDETAKSLSKISRITHLSTREKKKIWYQRLNFLWYWMVAVLHIIAGYGLQTKGSWLCRKYFANRSINHHLFRQQFTLLEAELICIIFQNILLDKQQEAQCLDKYKYQIIIFYEC